MFAKNDMKTAEREKSNFGSDGMMNDSRCEERCAVMRDLGRVDSSSVKDVGVDRGPTPPSPFFFLSLSLFPFFLSFFLLLP